MGNTIIAGLASEHDEALGLACTLADALDAKLTLVHVHDPGKGDADAIGAARTWLERVAGACGRKRVESTVAIDGSPARALHRLVLEREASLLVLGPWKRADTGHVGMGLVTQRLLNGSPCPVVLAPHGYRPHEPALVAVAVDDSAEAHEALGFARTLAQGAGARLRIWTVADALRPGDPRAHAIADELVAHLAAELPRALDPVGETLDGDADTAVVLAAERHQADVIVCGSRGYGPVRSVLLGSVSAGIARRAGCPVAIVPRSTTRLPGGSAAAGLAAAADWP